MERKTTTKKYTHLINRISEDWLQFLSHTYYGNAGVHTSYYAQKLPTISSEYRVKKNK